jgi:small subunit ribosomal protein S20
MGLLLWSDEGRVKRLFSSLRGGSWFVLQNATLKHRIAGFRFRTSSGESFMANSAQARKRARQALMQRAHNASLRTAFRSAVKKVIKAVDAGDKAAAREVYNASVKIIDRIADKGVFHKNKAARHKSRLSSQVKAMA